MVSSLFKTGIFCMGIMVGIATQNMNVLNAFIENSKANKQDFNYSRKPCHAFNIDREGYSLGYDARNRNPAWVLENLTAEYLEGGTSRTSHQFKEDENIPEHLRSTLNDYKKQGYDKGHLAPAADHKYSPEHMSETFYLTNVCPQCPSFNRGYWAKLEKYVRQLTKEYGSVDVVSGPLYLPYNDIDGHRYVKYRVIGESDVAVPTHFFKVIRYRNAFEKDHLEAYIMPNQEIAPNTCLSNFKTTVKQIEKLAGIIFAFD